MLSFIQFMRKAESVQKTVNLVAYMVQPHSPISCEKRLINGFFRLCVISDMFTLSSSQILCSMSTLSDISFFLPMRVSSQM